MLRWVDILGLVFSGIGAGAGILAAIYAWKAADGAEKSKKASGEVTIDLALERLKSLVGVLSQGLERRTPFNAAEAYVAWVSEERLAKVGVGALVSDYMALREKVEDFRARTRPIDYSSTDQFLDELKSLNEMAISVLSKFKDWAADGMKN